MKEKDKVRFYDTSVLTETPGIRRRAAVEYIETELRKRFSDEIHVISVKINETGRYRRLLSTAKGLPAYCEVRIGHRTGRHTECITVWSPLAWNDRFAGAPGGGTATGGDNFLTRPDNTSRGMTLPKAVINGFTGAMTDAGNTEKEWALDKKTGKPDWERIENWRARSTHFMTLVGKAVAEILHQRPVLYSYLHGGSGGGRQCLVEAQEYPGDYNGIWASCPAINWTKFLLGGLWPVAVMNSYRHILTAKKIRFFLEAAQNSVGGPDVYYRYEKKIDFDPCSVVGQKSRGGIITEQDAAVMREIWNGPRRKNGEQLWYGHRPGVLFWNVGIPIGAFYYSLIGGKPKPFFLCTHYARWITENPKQTFEDITMDEFERLFDESVTKFAAAAADKTDLSDFMKAGGKLMIDHGIDDPLIPVDGTLDYYRRLCAEMGGEDTVNRFCRLYITPGDGHGSCNWHGPGITESDGMTALMEWVEKGIAPDALRVVQVSRSGGTLCEGYQKPFEFSEK